MTFIQVFEYFSNIFFLLKNPNWVEIAEYHVLGLICTQKGQQITKLDF
jgi:hypothetical protein